MAASWYRSSKWFFGCHGWCLHADEEAVDEEAVLAAGEEAASAAGASQTALDESDSFSDDAERDRKLAETYAR